MALFFQLTIANALGFFNAEALCLVYFVVGVRAFEEEYVAVAFEREDVRTDTVEEPAVVADDYGTSGKVLKTLLECTQRVHVDIVGRLVEEQHVTLLLQCEGELQAVALTT